MEWVAPQSEVMKPGKCHSWSSTFIRSLFWHAYWPLTVE